MNRQPSADEYASKTLLVNHVCDGVDRFNEAL